VIRLRGLVAAVLTAVVLTVGFDRLVGTPVLWSALISLPLAAILLLFLSAPAGVEPSWAAPPDPPSAAAHLDASTLASRFADAMSDNERFRGRVRPRLAALALSTLRRRPGLADLADLDDERAAAALGPELHALLTDRSATMPAPAVLLGLLTRLEET
jgi:hypothetical protein